MSTKFGHSQMIELLWESLLVQVDVISLVKYLLVNSAHLCTEVSIHWTNYGPYNHASSVIFVKVDDE